MTTSTNQSRNATFEHRLAMLAASFTASSPIVRPSRVELLEADRAFEIERSFSLAAWLRRARDRVVRQWRRHAAIAELRGLDDRTLADIGVERDRIASVVDEILAPEAFSQPLPTNAVRHAAWRAPASLRQAGNARRYDQVA